MTDRLIRIKQYEQAADDKVSIGGIKWLRKWDVCIQCDSAEEAETLRARLAQPEPEPVAWMGTDIEGNPNKFRLNQFGTGIPLYTTPLQREWVGLTDEEIRDLYAANDATQLNYAWAIEVKLKEKNHG